MPTYALVDLPTGEIIRFEDRDEAPETLASSKPQWLPVTVIGDDAFDPATQRKDVPVDTIDEDGLTRTYTVRSLNSGELAALKGLKLAAISAEFRTRYTAPITYSVGDVDLEWDADDGAVTNIMGVTTLINSGVSIPNPRTWVPYGALVPVEITHDELIGLGAAIAARKDALFTIKKTKEYALSLLTDAADVAAFDPLDGWDG